MFMIHLNRSLPAGIDFRGKEQNDIQNLTYLGRTFDSGFVVIQMKETARGTQFMIFHYAWIHY